VWCVVCSVWCVWCGVWCLVCGVWYVVRGVWCVVGDGWWDGRRSLFSQRLFGMALGVMRVLDVPQGRSRETGRGR